MDKKKKQNEESKEEDQILKQVQDDKKERVEEVEQAQEFEEKYKRALADYQNLEKRVRDERISWIKTANQDLLLKFLQILDTLKLASKHLENQGLQVIIQQFVDTLKTEGVEKIQTKDKEFNPHEMECVQTAQGGNEKVLEELRAGYKIHDKVLRPAQVVVGKQ